MPRDSMDSHLLNLFETLTGPYRVIYELTDLSTPHDAHHDLINPTVHIYRCLSGILFGTNFSQPRTW